MYGFAGRGDEGQCGNGTTTDQYGFHKVSMPNAAGPIRLHSIDRHLSKLKCNVGCFNRIRRCLSLGLQQSRTVRKFCWNKPKHSSKTQWTIKYRLALTGGGGGQYGHWAAIDTSGNCYTWGYNGYGQLGHGNTNNTATATQVTPQAGVKVAKVVCAGGGSYGNTYFMLANGRLYACGYNGYGVIGDGSTTQRNSPVLVSTVGLETGKYVVDIFAPGGAT